MNIDKTTIIVIASATSCALSAAGSIVSSINARRNRATYIINQPTEAPVSAEVDTVVYEQMEVLKDLPLKDRLAGLEALKNGRFDDFIFHLRTN